GKRQSTRRSLAHLPPLARGGWGGSGELVSGCCNLNTELRDQTSNVEHRTSNVECARHSAIRNPHSALRDVQHRTSNVEWSRHPANRKPHSAFSIVSLERSSTVQCVFSRRKSCGPR